MRRIHFHNKLSVQVLCMIVLGLLISMFALSIISRAVVYLTEQSYIDFNTLTPWQITFLAGGMFLVFILTFILSFLLLMRGKIRYLKSIANTLAEIANGNLGQTIPIKGRDEITQVAQNINHMSMELENQFIRERQLEQAKNDLITNVSHDLRTPLTSIIGYLDLIKEEAYKSPEQFQTYIDTIYHKSQQLQYLMDELFEFTRLSSPNITLNLSSVDLPSVLQQIIGEYTPIFEEAELHLQPAIPDTEMPVLMDVEKMVRVYDNLLTNAIKYSTKPADVFVSLQADPDIATLKVKNQMNHPLPPEGVEQLFERFYRGDVSRKENEGTGLGLSISKKIVELHHGKIFAQVRNDSITFIVEQPLYKLSRA